MVYVALFVILHYGLSSLRGPLNGFLLSCPLLTVLDLQVRAPGPPAQTAFNSKSSCICFSAQNFKISR